MKVSLKTKIEHDTAVLVSEYSPKVTFMAMFITTQFTGCLLTADWTRKTFILCTGMFFSCKTKSGHVNGKWMTVEFMSSGASQIHIYKITCFPRI